MAAIKKTLKAPKSLPPKTPQEVKGGLVPATPGSVPNGWNLKENKPL